MDNSKPEYRKEKNIETKCKEYRNKKANYFKNPKTINLLVPRPEP